MHSGICCGFGGTGNSPFEGRLYSGEKILFSKLRKIVFPEPVFRFCVYPYNIIWKLTESWKMKEGKAPSDRYMKIIRIVSGACLGVGCLYNSIVSPT